MSLELKLSGTEGFVLKEDFSLALKRAERCGCMLHEKTGAGSDFCGWVSLPADYDRNEFARIKKAAEKIKKDSEVLIVIGIGGSYIGARAGIEFIKSPFYNEMKKDTPDIYFAGNNISGDYLNSIIELLGDRDFSVSVISKSGTTTEPAIAFRIFKEMLEKKYGEQGAKERIYAVTDKVRGTLKTLAVKNGYESFIIPDDIGGRYSVLTAVGLLPMAAAGIDIDSVMEGARAAYNEFKTGANDCIRYAAMRSLLYAKGKKIEMFSSYEPAFTMLNEWLKQLFAESEGKDGKGIFPVGASFSTDLHSIGQYIQDGERNMFETVLWADKGKKEIKIKEESDNGDGLNFLAGESLAFVNKKAFLGTLLAHIDGGVPNIVITIPEINAYYFGYLVYFFEKACGVSGYLLDVNPFDQPGVESYKKNMFALLGKPGYESLKAELEKRI